MLKKRNNTKSKIKALENQLKKKATSEDELT